METPSIGIQVSTLVKDLHTVASSNQPIIAPQEVIKARMDTCGACEFYKNNRCTKCGCFMEAKSRLSSLKCPIGKW
jgi:membrane protease subunit (stomatin/prohibitin family)